MSKYKCVCLCVDREMKGRREKGDFSPKTFSGWQEKISILPPLELISGAIYRAGRGHVRS